MNKSNKYLLITTLLSFLFCSGCLTDYTYKSDGHYQHIGMKEWLKKHINPGLFDNYYSQEQKSYEIDENSIEQLKDSLSKQLSILELFENSIYGQIPQGKKLVLKFKKENGEEVRHDVSATASLFNEKYLPHLKNLNQSEKEIASLRFQYVCEVEAQRVEILKEALKVKQEQESTG